MFYTVLIKKMIIVRIQKKILFSSIFYFVYIYIYIKKKSKIVQTQKLPFLEITKIIFFCKAFKW